MIVRPIKPLKIENTYLFERLRSTDQRFLFSNPKLPAQDEAFSTTTSFAANGTGNSLRNFQLRLILQYNALLAGTPGSDLLIPTFLRRGSSTPTSSSRTWSIPERRSTSDTTATCKILMSCPEDLPPPGYVTNTARGYINDSRQFFVKVSYLFRF